MDTLTSRHHKRIETRQWRLYAYVTSTWMRVQTLAKLAGVTYNTVGYCLRQLALKGLVERKKMQLKGQNNNAYCRRAQA